MFPACRCSLFGSLRSDCEQLTGQCRCKEGIGGQQCDMCQKGLVLWPRGCTPGQFLMMCHAVNIILLLFRGQVVHYVSPKKMNSKKVDS